MELEAFVQRYQPTPDFEEFIRKSVHKYAKISDAEVRLKRLENAQHSLKQSSFSGAVNAVIFIFKVFLQQKGHFIQSKSQEYRQIKQAAKELILKWIADEAAQTYASVLPSLIVYREVER